MGLIRGLGDLNKEQEKERAQRSSSGMFLFLKDGESARVRFITDGPEIISADYHRVNTGRTSRNNKIIYEDRYCGWDDGNDCNVCPKVDSDASKKSRKLNLYYWVYSVTRADGSREDINAPRLLRTGVGKNGYIAALFTTYLRKYSTLCDRDYEWGRTGSGLEDTAYSLIPEEKAPRPKELVDVLGKLPPLLNVAKGERVEWLWESKRGGSLPATQFKGVATKSLLERLRERDNPKLQLEEDLQSFNKEANPSKTTASRVVVDLVDREKVEEEFEIFDTESIGEAL